MLLLCSREGATIPSPSAPVMTSVTLMVPVKAHGVVDGAPEFLLAAQVPLGRLDRDVSKQELNLIEFPASELAQPSTRAPEIVRGQLLAAGVSGRRLHHVPHHFRRRPNLRFG